MQGLRHLGSHQSGGTHCLDLYAWVYVSSAWPVSRRAYSLLGEVLGSSTWVNFLDSPLQGGVSKSRGEEKLGYSPQGNGSCDRK